MPENINQNPNNNQEDKKIENIRGLTRKEKWLLQSKTTLKRIFAAYALASSMAIFGGQALQNVSRKITGYDEEAREEHAELKKKSEDPNHAKYFEEEKNVLQKWVNKFLETAKKITNGEMYEDLKLKYYNLLNFIDDAAFLVPAVLIFIMLGRFLNEKIKKIEGDPVQKAEKNNIYNKINEIINKLNSFDLNKLNEGQKEEVKNILLENKDIFNNVNIDDNIKI